MPLSWDDKLRILKYDGYSSLDKLKVSGMKMLREGLVDTPIQTLELPLGIAMRFPRMLSYD